MQVTLPEMGESVTEGTVSKWLKQVGEPVRQGEGLVEVTTDKVDAEIPAPANGTLSKILADAGKTIAVGAPLAEIQVGADGGGAQKREQVQTAPHPGPPPRGEGDRGVAGPPRRGEGDRKVASPAAEGEGNRNLAAAPAEAEAKVAKKAASNVSEGAELLARARGIDLAAVTGTGPDGLIRRRDVLNAIEEKERTSAPRAEKSGAPTPPSSGSAPPLQAQVTTGSIPLRGAAGAMVKHMEESLQVPTATSFRTLRVDVLDQRRRQLNQAIQAAGRPEKVSYTHVIAFAIVRAARDEPSMAVTFDRVDGVPTRVARGLHLGHPFRVGRNTWYVAAGGPSRGVLKVRHGRIEEVGITDRALTRTPGATRRLLSSFVRMERIRSPVRESGATVSAG